MINDNIKKIDELFAVILELDRQRNNIVQERDALPEQYQHILTAVAESIDERMKELHNEYTELKHRLKYEIMLQDKQTYSKDYYRMFSFFLSRWGKINAEPQALGDKLGDYLVFLQTYKTLDENTKRIIHAFYIKYVTVEKLENNKGQCEYKANNKRQVDIMELEAISAVQKNKAFEKFRRMFIDNIQAQINKSETVQAYGYVLTVVHNKINGDKILLRDNKKNTTLYASHDDIASLEDNAP